MMRPSWRMPFLVLGIAAIATLLLSQGIVRAQQPARPAVFTDFRSKLALDGHDAVAYFRTGKPTKGAVAYSATWSGATWHFASAENKAAFQANPEAFAPQYGGYCAWAVSEGYTAKGDPNHWRIVDGKLYVNYNASVQKNWEQNIPRHIARADKNWPTVLRK